MSAALAGTYSGQAPSPVTLRRWEAQTAIRRGELTEDQRAALAELVAHVGLLAEMPAADDHPRAAARWDVIADAYARWFEAWGAR